MWKVHMLVFINYCTSCVYLMMFVVYCFVDIQISVFFAHNNIRLFLQFYAFLNRSWPWAQRTHYLIYSDNFYCWLVTNLKFTLNDVYNFHLVCDRTICRKCIITCLQLLPHLPDKCLVTLADIYPYREGYSKYIQRHTYDV